jgi:hypothetical protein
LKGGSVVAMLGTTKRLAEARCVRSRNLAAAHFV